MAISLYQGVQNLLHVDLSWNFTSITIYKLKNLDYQLKILESFYFFFDYLILLFYLMPQFISCNKNIHQEITKIIKILIQNALPKLTKLKNLPQK